MNRADIREDIKMQLSTVNYDLAKQYSNPFLDKLIQREYENIVCEARAIRETTNVVTSGLDEILEEERDFLDTEAGIDISGYIDSRVSLEKLNRFYMIESISYNEKKMQELKFDNIADLSDYEKTSVKYYLIKGNAIYFINCSGLTVTIYYTRKPLVINDDTEAFEIDDIFKDNIVFGVLKRISMGNKALDYRIFQYEYENAMIKMKDYFRKKYTFNGGFVIPQSF